MANRDAPFGLRPVNLDGKPYVAQANLYYVASGESNNLFIGDPVKIAGSADANGIPSVARAAAGDPIVGVVIGVQSTKDSPLHTDSIYRPASTAYYVLVADDPDQFFAIQEDSDSATLAATDVGLNANIVIGAGSTTTGLSGVELDSDTADTTNSLDFQIVRLLQAPDNAIGDNAVWIVKPNTHHRAHGTTGL